MSYERPESAHAFDLTCVPAAEIPVHQPQNFGNALFRGVNLHVRQGLMSRSAPPRARRLVACRIDAVDIEYCAG
jgi:hypothetical protein